MVKAPDFLTAMSWATLNAQEYKKAIYVYMPLDISGWHVSSDLPLHHHGAFKVEAIDRA